DRIQDTSVLRRKEAIRIDRKGRIPLKQGVPISDDRHRSKVSCRIRRNVDLRRHRPFPARIGDEGLAHGLDRSLRGDGGLDVPHREDRDHWALMPAISWVIESFASPKSITVFGFTKSGFSIPAKPGFIERLGTATIGASATFRIGIP